MQCIALHIYPSMELFKNGQIHNMHFMMTPDFDPLKNHWISTTQRNTKNISCMKCKFFVYSAQLWATFVFENWFFVNFPLHSHMLWSTMRVSYVLHHANHLNREYEIESDTYVNCIIVQPKLLEQSWPISKQQNPFKYFTFWTFSADEIAVILQVHLFFDAQELLCIGIKREIERLQVFHIHFIGSFERKSFICLTLAMNTSLAIFMHICVLHSYFVSSAIRRDELWYSIIFVIVSIVSFICENMKFVCGNVRWIEYTKCVYFHKDLFFGQ